MARKRRRFTAEFKARVALEALRERDSVQAIAARHELHPNQVTTWKRQLLEGGGQRCSGASRGLAWTCLSCCFPGQRFSSPQDTLHAIVLSVELRRSGGGGARCRHRCGV